MKQSLIALVAVSLEVVALAVVALEIVALVAVVATFLVVFCLEAVVVGVFALRIGLIFAKISKSESTESVLVSFKVVEPTHSLWREPLFRKIFNKIIYY